MYVCVGYHDLEINSQIPTGVCGCFQRLRRTTRRGNFVLADQGVVPVSESYEL